MHVVTREWLFRWRTEKGGWNKKQLAALDLPWPPKKGWVDRLVGRQVQDLQARAFERQSGKVQKPAPPAAPVPVPAPKPPMVLVKPVRDRLELAQDIIDRLLVEVRLHAPQARWLAVEAAVTSYWHGHPWPLDQSLPDEPDGAGAGNLPEPSEEPATNGGQSPPPLAEKVVLTPARIDLSFLDNPNPLRAAAEEEVVIPARERTVRPVRKRYVSIWADEVVRETDKAWLVMIESDPVWVPKSQLDEGCLGLLYEGMAGVELEVTEWLAREKGLPILQD